MALKDWFSHMAALQVASLGTSGEPSHEEATARSYIYVRLIDPSRSGVAHLCISALWFKKIPAGVNHQVTGRLRELRRKSTEVLDCVH
jgi:hypothetical protein